jgi:hypothetical protein
VASILPFIRKSGAVFDDRVTQLVGEAFDNACRQFMIGANRQSFTMSLQSASLMQPRLANAT